MANTGRKTGQLIQRGDSWTVRVYVGRENGQRKYDNTTVHGTKKQAQAVLNAKLITLDNGTYVAPVKLTVGDFMKRWLTEVVAHRVRARTLGDYRWLVEQRIAPALGTLSLQSLRPEHVTAFYSSLLATLSPRSAMYTHSVLHSALRTAVRWKLIASNPASKEYVDRPKRKRREMLAFTPEQATSFLRAVEGDALCALWRVLLVGGLRPQEACGLRWTDLHGSELRIQRAVTWMRGRPPFLEEPKTPQSRRTIPLDAGTMQALTAHRTAQKRVRLAAGDAWQDNGGLVFCTGVGTLLDIARIRKRFQSVCKANGLPALRLYDLRHSSASLLLAAGENLKTVSVRLGHSTISQTADVYAHVSAEQQAQATDRLAALLAGGAR